MLDSSYEVLDASTGYVGGPVNRVGMVVLVILYSAFWWFLSHSVTVTTVIATTGLSEAFSWKRPPREISRDLMITSIAVGVVNLYIRLEWGYRPV